jgi:2-oxoisovalerate dehydrogenase E1 component
MFADFLGLCVDQFYNHATKLTEIKGSAPVSLVMRAPAGGRRGYGPTHSQCPEALLASIPGLTIVAPNHRCDPGHLLDAAIFSANRPVLFLEHKLLYALTIDEEAYEELPPCLDSGLDALFPTLVRPAASPDLTILTYSHMLTEAEIAAQRLTEEEELAVEIIVPSLLSPLPTAAIAARLARCERIVIAEEGPKAFGIGAELAAQLLEANSAIRLRRIGLEAAIIPAARQLEAAVLPDADSIVQAALSLFRESES